MIIRNAEKVNRRKQRFWMSRIRRSSLRSKGGKPQRQNAAAASNNRPSGEELIWMNESFWKINPG